MVKTIGVLALQGDFREHILMLKKLKVKPVEVRLKKDLENIQGLIIPGGESTTIGKLLKKTGLDQEIRKNVSADVFILCVQDRSP